MGGREPKNEPSARDVVPDERCVFFTSRHTVRERQTPDLRSVTRHDLLFQRNQPLITNGRDMAYPRMTPTIGRLELAQTEGKVLGENIERV